MTAFKTFAFVAIVGSNWICLGGFAALAAAVTFCLVCALGRAVDRGAES